jgi:hypothetical protein
VKKNLVSLVLVLVFATGSLPALAAVPREGGGRRFEPPTYVAKIIKRIIGSIRTEGDSPIPPIPKP